MKKINLFFLLCTICLMACNNENELNTEISKSNIEASKKRSLEEAKQIATKAIDFIDSNLSRSRNRTIDLNNIKFATSQSSRSSQANNDTLFYVFNYADNAGFAIVSALKGTTGLLAVTEEGFYDPNSKNYRENEGFTMFMDIAETYLTVINESDKSVLPQNTPRFDIITQTETRYDSTMIGRVIPMIETRWGQTGCEATFTPNGYSGCANTAMAQIMSYYQYPTQININYPGASISTQTLNWNGIKQHNVKHDIQNCIANEASHIAIGQLHRQLGHLTNSEYQSRKTSTNTNNVVAVFNQLGYFVPNFTGYIQDDITEHMSNGKPIFMVGEDPAYGGHGWVADGYLKYQIQGSEWIKELGETEWTLAQMLTPYNETFLHMNWGYDGNCNGYFRSNIFDPNNAVEYDNEGNGFSNSSLYNFTQTIMYTPVSK